MVEIAVERRVVVETVVERGIVETVLERGMVEIVLERCESGAFNKEKRRGVEHCGGANLVVLMMVGWVVAAADLFKVVRGLLHSIRTGGREERGA